MRVFLIIALVRFAFPIGTTGVLNGRVTDTFSKEPIAHAFISLLGSGRNTETDNNGYFSIAGVPAGTYSLLIERIGYRQKTISSVSIAPDATTNLAIELFSSEKVITVTSERTQVLTPQRTVTNYAYSDQAVKTLFPGPTGLNVRKIYENLPGVQIGNDAYYGFVPHIRGGTGYDVGYAFDGVPTYNNITFSENNIKSVGTNFTNVGTAHTDVYVGTYPAQYGNFISGFINQTAKRGEGPLHGSVEYQYGFWLDKGTALPSYDPATGTTPTYNGAPAYSPTNIAFELSGKEKRFGYYLGQVIQDGGMVNYNTGIDVKPLINELGGGLPYSSQKRDTVLNLTYDLNAYNDLQFLFYEGIEKDSYAGFQELPCNPVTTFGCLGTSTATGFGESFNANVIAPLSDSHDISSYDLEKFEWSHRFNDSGSLLNFRIWHYAPDFYFDRFDLPISSTLWEFERSSNTGVLIEHQNQITPQHFIDVGADFIYSKNYFLSSMNDIGFPADTSGVHFNPTQQVIFGPGPGHSFVNAADIIQVPDTQTWSAWVTDQWRPSERWLIEAGLRWDKQNTLKLTGSGIATDANGLPFVAPIFCATQGLCLDPARFTPSQITPRIGSSYEISDRLTMSASYGKFVTFSPSRRVDVVRFTSGFPGSTTFLPGIPAGTAAAFQLLGSQTQSGENLDVSWEYKLNPEGTASIKLTPYLKHMVNPLQIAIIGGFPNTVNAGSVESKGVELFLKSSEWRGLSGWLSYTYSNTRGSQLPYQTDLSASVINPAFGFTAAQVAGDAQQIVPTAYDQRHEISLNLNWKHGNWDFTPNLQYGSGYPYGIGLHQLQALAALQDPLSFLYGGAHTVAQSVATVPGFNPLGETGFNSLRMPAWWKGNFSATYHFSPKTAMTFTVLNLFNSNQIINRDNTVFSGIGYAELTNPNAFNCCYTSNDTTQNILPQYNPLHGQYAPIAYPSLRQFFISLRYEY